MIHLLFLLVFLFVQVQAMEKEQELTPKEKKFDSLRDYHHLYPQQTAVRSLMALCLSSIAHNIKDNIDPKKPLESKELIEKEIFTTLRDHDISPQCLLLYWKAHVQPLYEFYTMVRCHNFQEYFLENHVIWYDKDINKIALVDLSNDVPVISYRYISFGIEKIAISSNKKFFAIVKDNNPAEIAVFSMEYSFRRIDEFCLKQKITALIFCSEEKYLFAGTVNGCVKKINIKDGTICTYTTPYDKEIKLISSAPDGSYVIVCDINNTIYRINNTNEEKQNIPDIFEMFPVPCCNIIISPDSRFIFFKENNKQGLLFDMRTKDLKLISGDIVAIAPGNRLVVLTSYGSGFNLQIKDYKGDIKQSFVVPLGRIVTQSYDNTYLFSSCLTYNDKFHNIFGLYKPSLDQILYQLALEKSLKEGRDLYIDILLVNPLLGTFNIDARGLINRRFLKEREKNSQGVEWFVDTYVRPLLETGEEPITSIFTDELLDGYSDKKRQLILKEVKKVIEGWFKQQMTLHTSLEQKLSFYSHPGVLYLIHYAGSDIPFRYFDKLILTAVGNLVALKKIRLHIEIFSERDRKKLPNIQAWIEQLEQSIQPHVISSHSARELGMLLSESLDELYGPEYVEIIKEAAKQRFKTLVIETAQLSRNEGRELLEDCSKFYQLRGFKDLFNAEEVEHLDQIVQKIAMQKKIAHFETVDACVDFANLLPRMQCRQDTRLELKNDLAVKVASVYKQKIQDLLHKYLGPRKREQAYKGLEEFNTLQKDAAGKRDIFNWNDVETDFSNAYTQFAVLGAKLRQHDKSKIWAFANKEMNQLNIHM